MTPKNKVNVENKSALKGIDARVLGQIMAAQNILFVLPTGKKIAEFFAKSLCVLPGVSSCRVCLGNSFSQEGTLNDKVCKECKNNDWKEEGINTISKKFTCKLGELPNSYVFALETIDHRFGFFIFKIEQSGLFELYKPFVNNLGNFVALSLENRLQKSDLQRGRDSLENRVIERTRELQTANTHLEEEIEVRRHAEEALQQSEEHFRFLFETMAQGVIVQDAESKILDANNAASEILGLSRDQLLGKTAYDPRWKLIHEDGSPLNPEEMPSNIALRTCKPVSDILIGAYIPEKEIYHWILTSSTPKFKFGENKPYLTMTTFTNITERKQFEKERQANLQYFESIDRINRAMQRADNLEQMMSDVLDTMLSIFGCDRAFLAVPCDPTVLEFKISMERTNPLYPGAFARGEIVPMSPAVRNLFQELLDNPEPNEIFIGKGLDPDDVVWKTYEIKSQLAIALHPKVGKPWECGLHQCSYNREWTPQEKQLFLEISRRVGDALTSLLTHRDLKESEQRYRMVFENSPVSIWEEDFSSVKNLFNDLKNEGVTDIDTYFCQHPETIRHCSELIKIVDVNQSALVLHAATTKQELMVNLANTFTPESFDTFRQELICLWNGGTEMASDAIVKTLAGDVRNVTVYFSVCPGSEDTLSKILVSLVDITARKKAENALIKSETGLKEAQRIGRLGSWELDIANNILIWSDEIYRMFEIDHNEFGASYEAFINAIHPDDREKVDLAYINSLKTHAPYAIDHRLCLADGRVKYVQEQCETFYDGDSKPLRSVGIVQDITERKLAEEAIRISEAKYRIVADNTYDWEFWLDPEGQFLYTSPSCEGITGYKPFDFSADSDLIFRLVHPEDRLRFETHERASLGEYPEPEQEFRIIRANGEQRWIGHVCRPVYDERGKFLGLRGSNRDITERKLAEEEIRKLNQELEKRVIERTSQLELANKELEAFSYSVSHDLRAPLRGIDGFSQVLLDEYRDKFDEQGRNYLQRIRLASQRMAQLIDDMLKLSRIIRIEVNIKPVNLSNLTLQVAKELNDNEPGRNIEFTIQEGIIANADERLLQIVMENLIGNAWKYTSKHTTARIEFGKRQQDNKTVYFVKDDGAGFDMNYAQKLFTPFQRLHSADEFPGTGIGLATVQRIINKHGGMVWAEGELEKGATFYFTIQYQTKL